MNITQDDWTPLFNSLKEKISPMGRKKLLFQMIGDIQDIAVLNMGFSGIARPSYWPALTEKYAKAYKGGNRVPTLILTGALKSGFVHTISEDSATLTNIVAYADEHQFGAAYKNLPPRPFYPVSSDGSTLTPFAEARLYQIVEDYFQG